MIKAKHIALIVSLAALAVAVIASIKTEDNLRRLEEIHQMRQQK